MLRRLRFGTRSSDMVLHRGAEARPPSGRPGDPCAALPSDVADAARPDGAGSTIRTRTVIALTARARAPSGGPVRSDQQRGSPRQFETGCPGGGPNRRVRTYSDGTSPAQPEEGICFAASHRICTAADRARPAFPCLPMVRPCPGSATRSPGSIVADTSPSEAVLQRARRRCRVRVAERIGPVRMSGRNPRRQARRP